MHEIITISLSHRANHLTTQFFNNQDENLNAIRNSYIANSNTESTNKKNLIDPSINLNPTIDTFTKTVSYSPRCLLWEAKNGFGSLATYQYSTTTDDYFFSDQPKSEMTNNDNNNMNSNIKLINTHSRITKSEYQIALDSQTNLPKLTPVTATYWSDYCKLILRPNSFNQLINWYHNKEKPNLPDYQDLNVKNFNNWQFGQDEYDFNNLGVNFIEENLHEFLETTDSLQGFNVVTDFTSGWGGFTTSLLTDLRDEVGKKTIWSFGINDTDLLTSLWQSDNGNLIKRDPDTILKMVNKIVTTLQIAKDSDLLLPLMCNNNTLSNWETAGQLCFVMDTLNSVTSQNDLTQRKNMEYVTNCLQANNNETLQNIITSMKNSEGFDYSYHANLPHYNKNLLKNKFKYSRDGQDLTNDPYEFESCQIDRGDSFLENAKNDETDKVLKNLKYLKTTNYNPSDTIPDKYANNKNDQLKLSINENSRAVFKYWYDFMDLSWLRFNSTNINNNITRDDWDDWKNDLQDLISAYEFGWHDDDDSGDDL